MLKTIASLLEKLGEPANDPKLGDNDLNIASAALLVHAMAVDGTISEPETERLHTIIADHLALTPTQVNRLLIEAERQEREAIDIYRFTSILRDRLTLEQKRDIIALMWRVVFADGKLDALEDNLIWRTAELLAVPTRDRMQLKQMVRADLEAE